MMDEKTTDEITALIQKASNVLKTFGATDVFLFGSFAKRTFREDSDIDLAVSGIPPEKLFEVMGAMLQSFYKVNAFIALKGL